MRQRSPSTMACTWGERVDKEYLGEEVGVENVEVESDSVVLHRVRVLICRAATGRVALAAHATSRARHLRSQGLRDIDALHLAVAEAAAVEVLLTTDDDFIRAARNLQPPSPVRVNPVVFATEVIG